MFSNSEYHELTGELAKAKADASMFAHLTVVLGQRVAALESDLYRLLEREPAPEPDYEALGYPETRVWRLSLYDLDILAYQSGTWRDLFLTLCQEMDADKENQDDVDNG